MVNTTGCATCLTVRGRKRKPCKNDAEQTCHVHGARVKIKRRRHVQQIELSGVCITFTLRVHVRTDGPTHSLTLWCLTLWCSVSVSLCSLCVRMCSASHVPIPSCCLSVAAAMLAVALLTDIRTRVQRNAVLSLSLHLGCALQLTISTTSSVRSVAHHHCSPAYSEQVCSSAPSQRHMVSSPSVVRLNFTVLALLVSTARPLVLQCQRHSLRTPGTCVRTSLKCSMLLKSGVERYLQV